MSNGFYPSFAACVMALVLALAIPQSSSLWAHAMSRETASSCGAGLPGVRVHRTELYLGLSRPDGSTVSDAEFQGFVDTEVAARLLGGFTVVAGNGQFRNASGAQVKEPARVIVALYPLGDDRTSAEIERVRAAYRKAFAQESVLRVDHESCALP
jgi:hypothetical protein